MSATYKSSVVTHHTSLLPNYRAHITHHTLHQQLTTPRRAHLGTARQQLVQHVLITKRKGNSVFFSDLAAPTPLFAFGKWRESFALGIVRLAAKKVRVVVNVCAADSSVVVDECDLNLTPDFVQRHNIGGVAVEQLRDV
jgi:hypothetical protein